GQVTDSRWQSKAVWVDFDSPIEMKKGEKYLINYTLTGGNVMGIQLIGEHESESDRGDMQVKTNAGAKHSLEYTVRSTKRVRRIVFQIGKNAWGDLGGSQGATLVIHSITPVSGKIGSLIERGKRFLYVDLNNPTKLIQQATLAILGGWGWHLWGNPFLNHLTRSINGHASVSPAAIFVWSPMTVIFLLMAAAGVLLTYYSVREKSLTRGTCTPLAVIGSALALGGTYLAFQGKPLSS